VLGKNVRTYLLYYGNLHGISDEGIIWNWKRPPHCSPCWPLGARI